MLFGPLSILDTHLINKNADKVGIDHSIDDIDAEHHSNLIRGSCIYFDQGKGDSRVVPGSEPFIKKQLALSEFHNLAIVTLDAIVSMHFDVNRAEVDCWDPHLIRLQAEPHDTADNMSVDKDEKGVVHYLQHGLVLDSNRLISYFFQYFLQTLYFEK